MFDSMSTSLQMIEEKEQKVGCLFICMLKYKFKVFGTSKAFTYGSQYVLNGHCLWIMSSLWCSITVCSCGGRGAIKSIQGAERKGAKGAKYFFSTCHSNYSSNIIGSLNILSAQKLITKIRFYHVHGPQSW